MSSVSIQPAASVTVTKYVPEFGDITVKVGFVSPTKSTPLRDHW